MPIENGAQQPKKSNLRKPNSPKITGKHITFDEKNLQDNRNAEIAERLKSWEQKHPDIKNEYYFADHDERMKLIGLYATIQLYAHAEEAARPNFWDNVKGQLFSKDTQEMFSVLAKWANSWESCKNFLQDPDILTVIEEKGTDWDKHAGKKLNEILQLPEEENLRSSEALTEVFNKKHPLPEKQYFEMDLNGRVEMLREYLLPLLLKSEKGQDEDTLKHNIKQVDADWILKDIARKVQSWEVCKELLGDEKLQYYAANPDLKNERGDAFMKCAERLTANIKDHPKEKAFLDSLPKPPDPALAQQNIDAVRAAADAMFAQIEQVDFNLLGSGSKEFDAMKKSVKEFRRFAREEYQLNRNQEVPPELQKELLKKTQESLQSVKKYLDYKQDQFDKDPARRNASGRQKHEQPRILTSIKLFEDLSKLHFEQSMTEPGREHKETRDDLLRKSEFSGFLHFAKGMYTTNLASRQSKERMNQNNLFNAQDRKEAAKMQPKPKKAEAPKGMKK